MDGNPSHCPHYPAIPFNPDKPYNMDQSILLQNLTMRVPAAEFQKRIGHYQDLALQQPITITRHGEDRLVVVSAARFRRLEQRERIAMAVSEAHPEEVAAMLSLENLDPRCDQNDTEPDEQDIALGNQSD